MSKFKIFLVVFLILMLGAGYYVSTGYFSSGERAGTLSKLSERGYIFKTNEGVLNEGGYSGETGTLTPRYWEFSSNSDSVIVKLKEALSTGERVTLKYQEKFLKFPWNGDTKYFIIDVLFIPKPQPQMIQPSILPQPTAPQDVVIPADSVI